MVVKSAHVFIKRSMNSAFSFFKEAISSEDIARSPGMLQGADPRIKLALLAAFLITTCLAHDIYLIVILYAVSCGLAALSGVGLAYFIKRVWFFIPIFTAVIAIPAIFLQGLHQAALFTLRVAACVSFVAVFTITTRHNKLLGALRSVGVPAIFVQVLDMTYRYIFLFVKIFEEMHIGLTSRLVKKFDHKLSRRWVASRIAALLRRSARMSEEVYMAMTARGYR